MKKTKLYAKTHQVKVVKQKGVPAMYFMRSLQNVGKKGLPVILFIHGGGGNLGCGLDNFDKMSSSSRDNELVAVSMNYKLAPQY